MHAKTSRPRGPDRAGLRQLTHQAQGEAVSKLVDMLSRTTGLDVREAHEHGIAVRLEPTGVGHHDPLEPRQRRADPEHLVGLLLVLGEDEPRLAVIEHPAHLLGHRVDEDPERDRAERLGGQLHVEPGGPVARDHRDGVPGPEPEVLQPERHRAHVGRVLPPRHLLPDAELLLAQRHRPGAPPRALDESTGERAVVHRGRGLHRGPRPPPPLRRGRP